MQCRQCQAENEADVRFCESCGAPLALPCQRCGHELSQQARFCGRCGADATGVAPRDQESRPDAPLAASDGDPQSERRHLTVLFCDLVGTSDAAARLGPEQWQPIAAEYRRAAAAAVTRVGGHVVRFIGDGMAAYFGEPEEPEGAAEHAVRCGLAILEAMAALNLRVAAEHRVALAVRVGIHAGPGVVTHSGGMEVDLFGDAPDVASRVESLAEPDTVVVTAAVHTLLSGLFVMEDRGAHRLKGSAQPIQLHRVLRRAATRRSTGLGAHGLTPFVGREDELRLLLSRWARACEGEGQVVLVVGEPGIGKSRLLAELRARIAPEPRSWVACAGVQLFAHTPFHAVSQMVEQLVGHASGWDVAQNPEERVGRLAQALEPAGLKLGEAVPLIAEMLSLPIPPAYPALPFSPDQRRRRLFAALAAWVFATARLRPLVIAVEDAQWLDPSTLEFLATLVAQGAAAPLLLLATARPEFRAPWPNAAHHAHVRLNRLDDGLARAMVAGVVRTGLAKTVIDAVVQRTDGVPLFAEELTRLLLEAGARAAAREIPITLHDSLSARLGRLGRAKEVAQLGAVLGGEFSYEVLRAVSPLSDDALQLALAKLVDAELLHERGLPPQASYQFKHALIRDAAYAALAKRSRRDLHRRVAQTLTERFPALAEAQPEILARHWSDAGEVEPAVAAWTKAAAAANKRQALAEAEEGYRQALATLGRLAESPERDVRELKLANALSWVLLFTRPTAPETIAATARARELAAKNGNLPKLVHQAFAQCTTVFGLGNHASAASLADQTLDLARREGGDTSLRWAHLAQFLVRLFRGDLVGAESHFTHWRRICDASGYGQLLGETTNALAIGGLGEWFLGQADAARERIARASAFARDSQQPFELALARLYESWLCVLLRESEPAEAAGAEALAMCDELGVALLADFARVRLGWARAQRGHASEGVGLIRRGIAGLVEAGVRVGITDFLTFLSEAQALDGATADALATIEDALTTNPEELVYRPYGLTCRGRLRLSLGQRELAEADFRDAIALARTMRARAWELRATISLARLLGNQGQRDAARTQLAEIYDRFTEGFDTADLRDAKQLLDELAT